MPSHDKRVASKNLMGTFQLHLLLLSFRPNTIYYNVKSKYSFIPIPLGNIFDKTTIIGKRGSIHFGCQASKHTLLKIVVNLKLLFFFFARLIVMQERGL